MSIIDDAAFYCFEFCKFYNICWDECFMDLLLEEYFWSKLFR
ncbi:MAG: hypothetical protein ACFFKA_18600 [Candidatus Thorarchaeota archaeon]